MAAPLWNPLVSQVSMKFFKNTNIKIWSNRSKVWGFIYAVIRFAILATFSTPLCRFRVRCPSDYKFDNWLLCWSCNWLFGSSSTSSRRRESWFCDDCGSPQSYYSHPLSMHPTFVCLHRPMIARTHVYSCDVSRRFLLDYCVSDFCLVCFSWFSTCGGSVRLDLPYRMSRFYIPKMTSKVSTSTCGGRET